MRNLCSKCPHYYEQHGYECDDVDWGCTAFGREFENCPSFDDGEGNADFEEWGCNEKQNRIQYTIMQIQKKYHAFGKICDEKERRFYKKIYSVLPKEKEGYKAYVNGEFQGFYTRDFRYNMKGGHRHNHVKNATARMRKCKECGDPIVKGMEARIEIPLVRGRDDTMCRCCLRMFDEEIYHHNYLTVNEIEMMEADL